MARNVAVTKKSSQKNNSNSKNETNKKQTGNKQERKKASDAIATKSMWRRVKNDPASF